MDWVSSDVVRFNLGPILQSTTRIAELKMLITHLLLVLEFCNLKPTYRKLWARNLLLMFSDLTLGPSFLDPPSTCRISWARNLLMCSDLTLGLFVKVKQG